MENSASVPVPVQSTVTKEFWYYDLLPPEVKEVIAHAPYDFSCEQVYREYVEYVNDFYFLDMKRVNAEYAKLLRRNIYEMTKAHAAISPPWDTFLLNTRRQLDRATRMCYDRRSQPTRRRQS